MTLCAPPVGGPTVLELATIAVAVQREEERLVRDQEVGGSNPLARPLKSATSSCYTYLLFLLILNNLNNWWDFKSRLHLFGYLLPVFRVIF